MLQKRWFFDGWKPWLMWGGGSKHDLDDSSFAGPCWEAFLARVSKSWKIMGFRWSAQNQWKSMKINENQRKSTKINENQWKSMKINENQHLETMSHVGGWVKARFGRFWLCWALLRGVSGTSLRILGNRGISLVCSKSMKINENQWNQRSRLSAQGSASFRAGRFRAKSWTLTCRGYVPRVAC